MPYVEVTEVVLVHCSIVNHYYIVFLYTFDPI